MTQSDKDNQFKKGLLVLGIIWLLGAVCDRIWFALDRSVPAWDEADYLTGSLNYWQALQHPQWLNGEWWTSFWQLTSKVPPFTYIAAGIIQNIFGTGPDQATLVNLFFSAILLVSVYGLGVELFSVKVGLLAAALCQVLPGLYRFRIDFLLDYPLTAIVTLCFYCLTVWWNLGTAETQRKQRKEWFWAAGFGTSLGLALMVKQTAIFFLFTPLLWVGIGEIRNLIKNIKFKIKHESNFLCNSVNRIGQLITALLLSVLVFGPWYRTNWLLILTSGKRATVDSAIAEGDPALNTLDAWIFYWKDLPYIVSWPLLLVPIVALLLYLGKLAIRGVEQLRRKTAEKIEQLSALQAEFRKTGEEIEQPSALPPKFRKTAAEIEEQLSALPPEFRKTAAEIEQQPVLQIKLWHKVIVLICCCIYYLGRLLDLKLEFRDPRGTEGNSFTRSPIKWLAIFWVSAYLLCSININKDTRYVLPYLPVLSLLLAYWLTLWTGRWAQNIRRNTIGLAILLMLANMYPIGGLWVTQILSPRLQHYPYFGAGWPHQQVIGEIIKTEPYLRSTLGVLPSTPELNQHNFNYYGALSNFQVYGRQVGTRKKHLQQDARSLSWFLTKTGNQGSVPSEAQSAIVQIVEQGGDFQLQKTWNLPDESTLNLYHSLIPLIQVKQERISESPIQNLKLNRVIVPDRSPPGVPVPVVYDWSGPWNQLRSGLVLLTWRNSAVSPKQGTKQQRWLHDHAIAMGNLHQGKRVPADSQPFQVIERTAMLPPANLVPGIYTLEATYLNRQTGENYPIPVPPVTLNIDPTAKPTPAPELDLLTQLRTLAVKLPQGLKALDRIFDQTGRINQYDPTQDYLIQASKTLNYRLQQSPQNLDLAYALALAKVLRRQPAGAIAALERVTKLDSQNPYAYAYLAFVHLYDWHPSSAQNALKPALALNPNLPELQALSGVAALMQGNVVAAWNYFKILTFAK